jgi:hypothetical protein
VAVGTTVTLIGCRVRVGLAVGMAVGVVGDDVAVAAGEGVGLGVEVEVKRGCWKDSP